MTEALFWIVWDSKRWSVPKRGRTYLVPKERLDISIEEDLIEEIGRVEGYNDIPSKNPFESACSGEHDPGNGPDLPPFGRWPWEEGTPK